MFSVNEAFVDVVAESYVVTVMVVSIVIAIIRVLVFNDLSLFLSIVQYHPCRIFSAVFLCNRMYSSLTCIIYQSRTALVPIKYASSNQFTLNHRCSSVEPTASGSSTFHILGCVRAMQHPS